MTTRRIREVPNKLPHARIYLDDLGEIRQILVEACTTAQESFQKKFKSDQKIEIRVLYHVGDLRMDTVEDLMEYGSSAKDFTLEVIANDIQGAEFTIRAFWAKPELSLHYPMEDDTQWAVYGQIKAILERRQLRFKNAILNWPEWLRISSFFLITTVFPYALPSTHFPFHLFIYIGWGVLLTATLYVFFRPSQIFFVRSHERSKLLATARQGYIKAIVLLVIGGVVGKLIDLLFAHFKH